MKVAAAILGLTLMVGLSIYYEVTVWQECRATNSFLYCLRVLQH